MRNRFLLPVLGILIAAHSASATSIFSDFGSGGAYDHGSGWSIGNGNGIAIGADFKPTANATLGTITLAFGWSGGTDMFNFTLTTDDGSDKTNPGTDGSLAGSGLPSTGTPIETWTNVVALPSTGTSDLLQLTSVLNPTLTAGTVYWITAAPAKANSVGLWNWNTTGAEDPAVSFNGGSSWSFDDTGTAPAFQVDPKAAVTSGVPTPSSLTGGAALLAGLLCMTWNRRKVVA